ncbi:SGNH/GDSL hydrolase family protein [Oleomonas cavernae]|uniref:SGNH/GDSL hydrolase family protein n=1 Tax=Oleomonas cavernae TaxID=2320859 RepID=A0A418WD84_9PROT|nr:SGNH/GDSL hydrolase family protein [Oleomonas cavernae]RJF87936.1 SGNH/GDSL hydrolase family protein [Oleomonas cavernae]
MSALLAGLVVLVIGDSHMVHKNYLIDELHQALTAQGATVYSFGACGTTPTDFLVPHTTDCGRASRLAGAPQKLEEGPAVPVWNAHELIAKYKPGRIIIVMGDTMGAYKQADFPKAWIWDQVSSLTGEIKSASVSCDWVGPPWGTEGGSFGKTYDKVKQLSDYLSQVVAPCRYIDSTGFARPGEWKTIDGQHLNAIGYKAWAAGITKAVTAAPAAPPPGAATPATGAEPW